MARRKKNAMEEQETKPMLELTPGFYLVDENQQVKTREVTRGKPGQDRTTVTEPIRFRTINSAKDALSIAGNRCAILGVVETFDWPK